MTTTWSLTRGLLGFPDLSTLTFTPLPDAEDLYGVLAGGGFEFVLARPGVFFPDLSIDVPTAVADELGLTGPGDADVWVIVTQTGSGFYANLRGPVVVNKHTLAAAQVVLDDSFPTAAALQS